MRDMNHSERQVFLVTNGSYFTNEVSSASRLKTDTYKTPL